MKITHIAHACILVEAGGVTILSDPWWKGPCFGAQWWVYPRPHLAAIVDARIDYIYISHGHHDHLHPGTLRAFAPSATILVSAHTGLTRSLQELGFEVIEVGENEAVKLGDSGVECRILPTHGDDTLMTLTDGSSVCVNINDALHSAPDDVQARFIERLGNLHPQIDYLFCGYGVASHFPNCYVIPGKDHEQTALKRQQYFNRKWAMLMHGLNTRFAFPFAADVIFLEKDLFWANKVTHNGERPGTAFQLLYPDSSVEVIDIAPGFTIENGKITNPVLRVPLDDSAITQGYSEEIARANRYGSADAAQIAEVKLLLEQNLAAWGDYLLDFPDDYRFLIRFRGGDHGIAVIKRGRKILLQEMRTINALDYDVIYTTRVSYLKWAMTQAFGDEILFVGSGGIFEFRDQRDAIRNLHRELIHLLKKPDSKKSVRRKLKPYFFRRSKEVVKKLLGRQEMDLYDLATWTVFSK